MPLDPCSSIAARHQHIKDFAEARPRFEEAPGLSQELPRKLEAAGLKPGSFNRLGHRHRISSTPSSVCSPRLAGRLYVFMATNTLCCDLRGPRPAPPSPQALHIDAGW